MRLQDFHYDLPGELIAKKPTRNRSDSRLLRVDGPSGELAHLGFRNVLDLVEAGDLLVFNDTKVIPARVFGKKESGGKVEVLIERVLDDRLVLAHVRASKSPKPGTALVLEAGTRVEVVGRQEALFELKFSEGALALEVLENIGHMPLPPYIDRPDDGADRERYQTVYGRNKGAVAAPTAGLHFDQSLLDDLSSKGVEFAFVTLHVGAGTFAPVRVDDIRNHHMHSERMTLTQEVCQKIQQTKRDGKRVIAVGTTSVRCLETAALKSTAGELQPYCGDTDIFIYPGVPFALVDGLITNFHLPQSTLLMLVSAFIGYKNTMNAYQVAVQERYRFFSYGDAMFLTRNPQAAVQEIRVD